MYPAFIPLQRPMSIEKSQPGPSTSSDTDHLRTVSEVLRRIATDGDRVTLAQIASESGLSPADAEEAMCNIERVSPLSAKRLVEPGEVVWEVSL